MRSDLFHVYPTDGYVNNRRGNMPFGENQGESYQSEGGLSKVGRCTVTGFNGPVFEPADEYKGDFARTYFYMATRYEDYLNNWTGNIFGPESYPGIVQWQLQMLLRWAKNDPVSEKETKRNEAIYQLQHNRNPFIDYPGLEQYVWGDSVNVVFHYDGKTNVLENCCLSIRDGEKIAVVGASGAGKSTIAELIARFYDVDEGEVMIGGKNVKNIRYEALLQNVSIVFQKTFLTQDSVFDNICMGLNASLTQVRKAAREAQIDEFIMSLPDGYDTKVGSYGSRFSGGEKQRIAIARAILKNAPILILDEATSAADPENQMEIDKAIKNLCKGKTVIIIAHRLSVVRMCDRVLVVEKNTITDIGTHDELLSRNIYYKKSWESYEASRNITYRKGG